MTTLQCRDILQSEGDVMSNIDEQFDARLEMATLDSTALGENSRLINKCFNNTESLAKFKQMYFSTTDYNINKIVNYVKRKGGFSNQEIEFLFDEYYKIRESRSDLENILPRTILILGFRPLLSAMMKKFCWFYDREDLEMKGMETLVNCVDKYKADNDSQAKFITYATQALFNNLHTAISHSDKASETAVSIFEPLRNDDDSHISLVDVLEDKDAKTFVDLCADKEQVMSMLRYVSPKYQYIIIASYGLYEEAKTLNDLGKQFNLSRERIRQLQNKGLEKIRQAMRMKKDGKGKCLTSYPVLTFEEYVNFDFVNSTTKV